MKKFMIATALVLSALSMSASASESVGEKASAEAHNAKRSLKKTGHRVQEAFCAKGDVACLEQKAKHRGVEGKDYVKDKAAEAKDTVDSDSKSTK